MQDIKKIKDIIITQKTKKIIIKLLIPIESIFILMIACIFKPVISEIMLGTAKIKNTHTKPIRNKNFFILFPLKS